MEEGLWKKIRKEQSYIEEQKKEDEQDFFDIVSESLDPVKYKELKDLERKYSYRVPEQESIV